MDEVVAGEVEDNGAKLASEQILDFATEEDMIRGSSVIPEQIEPVIKETPIKVKDRYTGPPESDFTWKGFPYLGGPIDIKRDDPQAMLPVGTLLTHVKQLSTVDPEDIKEYGAIKNAISLHKSRLLFEEKHYNEAIGGWHILIGWADPVYLQPTKRKS